MAVIVRNAQLASPPPIICCLPAGTHGHRGPSSLASRYHCKPDPSQRCLLFPPLDAATTMMQLPLDSSTRALAAAASIILAPAAAPVLAPPKVDCPAAAPSYLPKQPSHCSIISKKVCTKRSQHGIS